MSGDPYILYRAEKAIPFCEVNKDGARTWPATEEIAVELLWFMQRFKGIHSKYELVLRSAAAKYNLGRINADKVMRGEYDPGQIQFRDGYAPRDYQAQNAMLWRSVGGLLCADGLGTGKAQPLDCKVLTPDGWDEIGNLKVGDSVIDPDGGMAEVKGVYDRGVRKVYRVTTKDGRSTRCCDEHLWTVLSPERGELVERTIELRSFQYEYEEYWYKNGTLLPVYDLSNASIAWQEIESIEFESCLPTVCIAVTSKRNLYVTDDCLVTHNTISGLAGIAGQEMLPALIVAPSALCLQWKQQIELFLPGLSSHIIKQQRNYDLQVVATCEKCGEAATAQSVATRKCKYCKGTRFKRSHADIYLLSYNLADHWKIEISRVIKSVIYEEAHELRLDASAKYKACKYIANHARYRLGLTGSPVMNWGGEMFNIINLLCPGKLGTKSQFQETWCGASEGAGKEPPLKQPEAFAQYLKNQHMMTRRTREDVGRYIPEEQQIIHTIDFDANVFSRMTKDAKELAQAIIRMSDGQMLKSDNLSASRFNQMVYHATGVSKAPAVANFAEMILESGEPIMLFGYHRDVFEIWCRMLGRFNPLLFTGSESRNQKEHNKQQFMAGKSNLIICSLMSGVGIDGLQHRCNIGVFGELAWSPGTVSQCLSMDTEVLTKEGFKKESDIKLGDMVCGYHIDTGAMEWVPVEGKVVRPLGNERMLEVTGHQLNLRVTEGHRMVVSRYRRTVSGNYWGDRFFAEAGTLLDQKRTCVPTAGFESVPGIDLTLSECKLLGLFMTDGGFTGRGENKTLNVFQAAHQPWCKEIEEILSDCDLRWNLHETPRGMRVYSVPYSTARCRWDEGEYAVLAENHHLKLGELAKLIPTRCKSAIDKKRRKFRRGVSAEPYRMPYGSRGWQHLKYWLHKDPTPLIQNATREQVLAILYGMWLGDGRKRCVEGGYRNIGKANKGMIEGMQSLCVRRGISATVSARVPSGKVYPGWPPAKETMYHLVYHDSTYAVLPHRDQYKLRPVEASPDEMVWCLTNRLSTLVVRRKGKVAVVGNCRGRYHRDGQQKSCLTYILTSEVGIDPYMLQTLGVKRLQVDGVVQAKATSNVMDSVDTMTHLRELAKKFLAA